MPRTINRRFRKKIFRLPLNALADYNFPGAKLRLHFATAGDGDIIAVNKFYGGDMASVSQGRIPSVPGSVPRSNTWLFQVVPVVIGLSAFGLYATLRAFEGAFFRWGPYLSPFYSPLIDVHHHYWPYSPALLILGGPLSFRMTCYYYRKAYYRAFFLDPAGCAVPERKGRKYSGETKFPFILQNAHRYCLYVAVIFLGFLWHDAIQGFFFTTGFGVGVGSLVLLINVILLSLYLFSCHSVRHLFGGRVDCYSCVNFGHQRHGTWKKLSFLNEHHMFFAWVSLFSVGLADLYIRLLSAGVIRDIRLL